MSDIELSQETPAPVEKPQEVLDLEKALMDINSYRAAVGASTFPGSQAKNINNLLGFLEQTFKQLMSQYQDHPFMKAQESSND